MSFEKYTDDDLNKELRRRANERTKTEPGRVDGAYIVVRIADNRGGFVVEAIPRPGRTGDDYAQDYKVHAVDGWYHENPKSLQLLGYFTGDIEGMFAVLRDQFIEGEEHV